jgi:hypothetical protein
VHFVNLKILRKRTDLDPDIVLFVGALSSSLVGFVVGALFAPETYQYFPYFAVAFTATLLQTIKEQDRDKGAGPVNTPPPKRRAISWRFMPIATEQAQSPLSADLQAILRCLSCGSKLDSDDGGGYVCSACKRAYPKVNGIARFVDAQHYAASFGFQWHRYQKTQLDHDEVRESEHNFPHEDGAPARGARANSCSMSVAAWAALPK